MSVASKVTADLRRVTIKCKYLKSEKKLKDSANKKRWKTKREGKNGKKQTSDTKDELN